MPCCKPALAISCTLLYQIQFNSNDNPSNPQIMKKKYSTIQEVFDLVSKLEASTKRLPELLGFRSSDISKSYKKLITLCNSVSIIFLQYSLPNLALDLLKKASDADKGLKRHGSHSDKLWQGSLITSCNLALLFHK